MVTKKWIVVKPPRNTPSSQPRQFNNDKLLNKILETVLKLYSQSVHAHNVHMYTQVFI
jgi:hypothetical protein